MLVEKFGLSMEGDPRACLPVDCLSSKLLLDGLEESPVQNWLVLTGMHLASIDDFANEERIF